jgi:hypothetical protein
MSRGAPQRQEIIKQTFVVRDEVLTVTGGASTAAGKGSIVIGDFPEGNILFLGAVAYMQFSGSGADDNLAADWEGDFGVGTAPNSDADLGDGTDVDIISSTALAAASAEVGARTRGTNATQAIFDNTDGSLEINLNLITDDDDVTDSEDVDLTVNGELTIAYIVLGDD